MELAHNGELPGTSGSKTANEYWMKRLMQPDMTVNYSIDSHEVQAGLAPCSDVSYDIGV